MQSTITPAFGKFILIIFSSSFYIFFLNITGFLLVALELVNMYKFYSIIICFKTVY